MAEPRAGQRPLPRRTQDSKATLQSNLTIRSGRAGERPSGGAPVAGDDGGMPCSKVTAQ